MGSDNSVQAITIFHHIGIIIAVRPMRTVDMKRLWKMLNCDVFATFTLCLDGLWLVILLSELLTILLIKWRPLYASESTWPSFVDHKSCAYTFQAPIHPELVRKFVCMPWILWQLFHDFHTRLMTTKVTDQANSTRNQYELICPVIGCRS